MSHLMHLSPPTSATHYPKFCAIPFLSFSLYFCHTSMYLLRKVSFSYFDLCSNIVNLYTLVHDPSFNLIFNSTN